MPETWFDERIATRVPASSLIGHYTHLDTFVDRILPNRTLKFGRLAETNDPRENKEWSFAAVQGDYKALEHSNRLLNEVRSRCYVACGTRLERNCKCYGHPAMWHHYGDKHKGVCLLFNGEEMDRHVINYADSTKMLRTLNKPGKNVTYSTGTPFEEPPDVSEDVETQVQQLLHQHADYFVFQKHPDWENENEYRWLMIANNSANQEYLVPFEGALIGVVLGADIPDSIARCVIRIAEEAISNVETAKMKWNVFMEEGLALRCF